MGASVSYKLSGKLSSVPYGTSILEFNVSPLLLSDTTTDQTDDIEAALVAASAGGFALYLPAGRYNYNGTFADLTCSLYGDRGHTFIHATHANGVGTRWDFSDATGLVIDGLTYVVDNTPVDSVNDATETSAIIRVTNSSNVKITNCEFRNTYGTPILLRNVTGYEVAYTKIVTCYKDGIHQTGSCIGGNVHHNTIIDGGDDGIAVVGYTTGDTLGQPNGIIIQDNIILGVKFARCIAIVGGKNVNILNNMIDGQVPANYPGAGEFALAGIYIASEAATASHAVETVLVEGGAITNCGSTGYGALHIGGRSGTVSSSITVRDLDITRSAGRAVDVVGAAVGALLDVTLDNVSIYDNTDPNAVIGVAGAGTRAGIEVKHTTGFSFTGKIYETGGAGGFIGNTCRGRFDIDVVTKKINKSGTAGNDVFRVEGSSGGNTGPDDLYIETTHIEQTQVASSGTAYYIDRHLEIGTGIQVRKARVNDLVSGLSKFNAITPSPSQSITPSGSPFIWENTTPYPVMVAVNGGTVSLVERSVYTDIVTPVWSEVISGKVSGLFLTLSGEAVRVTYSSAPTMSYTSCLS